jgi:hypothetical protein
VVIALGARSFSVIGGDHIVIGADHMTAGDLPPVFGVGDKTLVLPDKEIRTTDCLSCARGQSLHEYQEHLF